MKRNIEGLSNQEFDVLVIGGGIHGALTAWDAALRGLSVALVERGDFGGGTSQNSLKIIHGGVRYLQDGNLSRIRKMASERTTWMKIAPHLVHPIRCLMPTTKKVSRSKLAMTAALTLNDILSFDRNRLPDPEKRLPSGRVITPQACAQLLPGYDLNGVTGAAVWHDAVMVNSERLVLEFILSAAGLGAQIANYVEAVGLMKHGGAVTGVHACDARTGQVFDIRSKVVVNCAGAWIAQLLEDAALQPDYATSVAMNLIVDKVWEDVSAGISSHPGGGKRTQMLFVVPWRDISMIGTWHIPWDKPPDAFKMKECHIQAFIDEINTAHPALHLTMKDVRHAAWGFLPVKREDASRERVKLARDDQVIDHQQSGQVSGLISVVSVKYTTARVTAQKSIDLAVKKLGRKPTAGCRTHVTPVIGGNIADFKEYLAGALANAPAGIDAESMEHLVYTYGSNHPYLLDCIKQQPSWGGRIDPAHPVTVAEVMHALQHEMTLTLLDLVQRRTELGAAGLPSIQALETCASLMGLEYNWDIGREQREIDAVIQAYPFTSQKRVSVHHANQ